ncbi:MAG TPA: carboxypeptidase-like regulatory domain-containing protein [Bacteroidales bacterium]|nr:carboxypeptidase-like regulatory domain-containing protein [Bacteroidales bacterium]HPB89472.1 carboxypeptidase-like regulatory domain-containing protein [Bacteroidales bacterium]HPY21723.1 carboxypeptidase-like regulatory domain-containing protein [Bacteroidales bacterium]HQA93136.1 carboxypeptidase-like regulatory domain-containing protein [Bacteroidales bacterium]HQP78508.1 carboxypeptidase-like regulatory domain-containing protein [Bacteroidales bacterium]
MKRFFSILVLSLLSMTAPSAHAETEKGQNDFFVIYGKIIDTDTRAPLYFASINLDGTNIANVTNSEGFFSLKLPLDVSGERTITTSYLGYLSTTLKISDFSGSSDSKPLIISMKAVPLSLDPATIRGYDARALFYEAYSNIKHNYPQKDVGMTAFYREMVKKGSSRYLSLNEAIIDIEKAAYDDFFSMDKAAVYEGRGSINYNSSDTLFIHYQGGIMSALYVDLVKRPFAGVYFESIDYYYNFKMGQSTIIDDKFFYVVEFDQKTKDPDASILYRGRIFIESESLAIGRIEFAMNVEGRKDAGSIFVPKKPANLRVDVEQATYIVNFKEYDDLWYYDYARLEVKFSTRRKRAIFRNYYSVLSEMAVTDHKVEDFKIDPEKRIRYKDVLSERVKDFQDDGFWEHYNIIEPDASIDAIIRRIIRQLNRREKN